MVRNWNRNNKINVNHWPIHRLWRINVTMATATWSRAAIVTQRREVLPGERQHLATTTPVVMGGGDRTARLGWGRGVRLCVSVCICRAWATEETNELRIFISLFVCHLQKYSGTHCDYCTAEKTSFLDVCKIEMSLGFLSVFRFVSLGWFCGDLLHNHRPYLSEKDNYYSHC